MRKLAILLFTCAVAAVSAAVFAPSALALDIADASPTPGLVGVPYLFQFDMSPGSGSPGMTWRISSGSLPPGLNLSYEGERWARVVGTPTTAGSYTFYLQAIDLPGPYVCCTEEQFTIVINEKLTVSTQSVSDAQLNQPYGPVQLTASGGTVQSWSIVSGALPPGMSLSGGGALAGTPTSSGSFTFMVKATGSNASDTKQLTIFVLAPLVLGGPGGTTPKSEPVPLNTKVLAPFSWGVQAAGGKAPYKYTGSGLPTGLTLDAATGALTGIATTPGAYKVVFTVQDALGGSDTLSATLNVKALLAFGLGTPKPAKVGASFTWRIPVTGASKTKTFLASGNYPPGLSLDEFTGVLSGRPLVAGSYAIKVWILGDSGTVLSRTYRVKVKP